MPATKQPTIENSTPGVSPDDTSSKAYEFIALSASLVVQDATDNLRNINTMCAAAMGVAMSQALEEPSAASHMQQVIDMIRQLQDDSAKNYQQISSNVTALLGNLSKK